MNLATDLKEIDAALVAENEKIAAARTCIKKLIDERDNVEVQLAAFEREQERAAQIKRGEKWKREHPKEHAAFLEKIRKRNQEEVIEGFLDGWWDLDDDGNMIAPVQTFKLSDFDDVKVPMMAHVMAKAGIFTSIGQARKNGWYKPLVEGEWIVTKKKIRIKVVK